MRRLVLLLPAASAVLAVSGCTGSSGGDAASPASPTTVTTSTVPAASTAPTPSTAAPTADAPTTTTPSPAAATGPSMTPGTLGTASTGAAATRLLTTTSFVRAASPCGRQRLDVRGQGAPPSGPAVMLDEASQKVNLIYAGSGTRTDRGVGIGSSLAELRAAYGADLLPTDVTGETAYVKVVDGRRILQLNLEGDRVVEMYTFDVRDWGDLAAGEPTDPGIFLDGLGGQC